MNYKVRLKVFKHGELVNIYSSIKEAADDLGLYPVLICRALKSSLPYARGYTFERIGHKKRKLAGRQIEVWHHGKLMMIGTVKEASDYSSVSDSAIRHSISDIGRVRDYFFKIHKDERKRIKR